MAFLIYLNLSFYKQKTYLVIKCNKLKLIEEKSLLAQLLKFYKEKSINFTYTISYMYKKNKLLKKIQKIILTIKNLILVDTNLLNKFQIKDINIANYLKN